jgi:hypothetical protein
MGDPVRNVVQVGSSCRGNQRPMWHVGNSTFLFKKKKQKQLF